MSAESHPTLPPVRLHSDAELARDALGAPLFARAVRLARWAGPDTRVGIGGELVAAQLPEAAAVLGLDAADAESAGYASQAWRVAVDTGLVDVTEPEEDGGVAGRTDGGAADGTSDGEGGGEGGEEQFGTAAPGEDLALVTRGAPGDVLDLWLAALDAVLADAAVPDLDGLVDALDAGARSTSAGWTGTRAARRTSSTRSSPTSTCSPSPRAGLRTDRFRYRCSPPRWSCPTAWASRPTPCWSRSRMR